MQGSLFIADLGVVLGVAALTSVIAHKLRQPTILGYLLAGLIVGPYIPIPLFAHPERVAALAEFGVVLVMFAVGLEFRPKRLAQVLPVAGLTGVIQISFLVWAGFSLGQLLAWGLLPSLFLGASIAISSTMVVSKVFERQSPAPDVREFVFGVLVLQDVAAIVMIAALTGAAAGGGLRPSELAQTLGRLAAVLLSLLVIGMLTVPRAVRAVKRLGSTEITVVVAVGLCFAIALLAEELGYSVALGAFLAGMLVAESGLGLAIQGQIRPLRDVFAAIFFVSIGMAVEPSALVEHLPTSLLVFAVVVVGQLLSVAGAGLLSGKGLRRSIVAGLALGQVGEFGFILAEIGVESGVAGHALRTVLVTVAALTAFTTPVLLQHSERLVHAADIFMPRRVRDLLNLYETWLERAGQSPVAGGGSIWAGAVRAIALDAGGLLLLLGAGVGWFPEAVGWLEQGLGASPLVARFVLGGLGGLACVPLLLGLGRNTRAIARHVCASLDAGAGSSGSSTTGAGLSGSHANRLAARAASGLIVLVVVLAVGTPAVAVMRPITGESYGIGVLAVLVFAIVAMLWTTAGEVQAEIRSGAATVANLFASRTPGDDHEPELLPGLDRVVGIRVQQGRAAIGRSLAELDLRARTGATVVAIQRTGAPVILPKGQERLEAGDVLAVTGTTESVEAARRVLQEAEHLVAVG